MYTRQAARGNAMFLILIAVCLFAALAFAISKDMRGASSAPTDENARLYATEIIQTANAMRPVIDRMFLLGGVKDADFRFAANGANATYGVVDAAPTAEIFNNSGGKLRHLDPPSGACTSTCAYEFTGQYTVNGVGSDSKAELAMVVAGLTQATCDKVNTVLNLGFSSIPTEDALSLTRFAGLYGDTGAANPVTITGAGNILVGKRAFCYQESSGSARYIFVSVLRGR